MENWQEERIWIWLIAASKKQPDDQLHFFINLENKILFTQKGKNGSSKKGDPSIIEYPAIDDSFPLLEDPNAHIFSRKKEDIEKMNDSYRRMKYGEKVLRDLGLAFDGLKAL